MEDSFPLLLPLPSLRYPIGSEPNQPVSVNQHSSVSYIDIVKKILTKEEFQRIRNTFMWLVIKLSERHLQLSGKIIHVLLARSILTEKENELFSIREFHMMTGLKCIAKVKEKEDETDNQDYTWYLLKGGHSLDDLEEQLSKTSKDLSDEEVYTHLLKSIKRVVKTKLENVKYDLQGFPLAFHLWILESIPLLQSAYSTTIPILQTQETTPLFLCENTHVWCNKCKSFLLYFYVLMFWYCVNVSNEYDCFLFVAEGYKIKADDWRNRSIDNVDAIEEITRRSSLFGNVEIGHKASSSNENCLVSKLKRLNDKIEDNFKSMTSRLSIMEERIKDLKTRMSILEEKHISDNKMIIIKRMDDTNNVEDEVDDIYNMEHTYTSRVSRTVRGEHENTEVK
ncbi:hypothetical protein N665_0168s0015 [Sinapis alba]|nr:hypothetical protein N665_0168s0015 [Sinapis alba]